jgi:hypothetical protein
LKDELDNEIDELWKLMRKHSKRMYYKEKMTIRYSSSLTEKYFEGKENGRLQNKIWDPGGFKSSRLVIDTLLQKIDKPHRQEYMNTFYFESLMQEDKISNSIC